MTKILISYLKNCKKLEKKTLIYEKKKKIV